MIKNGRDRALKTLEKEPDILVIPFSLSDIQWLIKNHFHFIISLIGLPGQIDNNYPDEKWVSALPLLQWLPPQIFSKGPITAGQWVWGKEGVGKNPHPTRVLVLWARRSRRTATHFPRGPGWVSDCGKPRNPSSAGVGQGVALG